jgi:hypothetical protein
MMIRYLGIVRDVHRNSEILLKDTTTGMFMLSIIEKGVLMHKYQEGKVKACYIEQVGKLYPDREEYYEVRKIVEASETWTVEMAQLKLTGMPFSKYIKRKLQELRKIGFLKFKYNIEEYGGYIFVQPEKCSLGIMFTKAGVVENVGTADIIQGWMLGEYINECDRGISRGNRRLNKSNVGEFEYLSKSVMVGNVYDQTLEMCFRRTAAGRYLDVREWKIGILKKDTRIENVTIPRDTIVGCRPAGDNIFWYSFPPTINECYLEGINATVADEDIVWLKPSICRALNCKRK